MSSFSINKYGIYKKYYTAALENCILSLNRTVQEPSNRATQELSYSIVQPFNKTQVCFIVYYYT